MKPLPIDELLPELLEHLEQSASVIIEAPPGSGKTTRVAPRLIDAGLCHRGRRTYLLQPRRVAATATAQRIAAERNSQLGSEIGYHVRFDRKVSDVTSLIVATEGILLRRLASDPTLDEVGTIVLDEFHERSLNADLILGMLRQVQSVRDDLRLIVMSATLDAGPLKSFLGAPIIKSTGTLHPVAIKYHPPGSRQKLVEHVAQSVVMATGQSEDDVLVFLPGVGEISQVESLLQREPTLHDCVILHLHGSLPLQQQSQIIRPASQRRIILSTNVAETSLTIQGIGTVIDSGQVRVLRFNPAKGLDRLQLEPICQSSATQRTGRAGRLASGSCVRLWDEKSHRSRPTHLEPEIRRVDLSSAVLQLYVWGERPDDFPWLEVPRKESIAAAEGLLEQLGAIKDNRITELGQRMAKLPTSPRLARMLIASGDLGHTDTICLVAAMLSERSPFTRESRGRSGISPRQHGADWNCDVTQRAVALQQYYQTGESQTMFGEIHRGAAQTIQKVAADFVSMCQSNPSSSAGYSSEESIPRALLLAFPDRLARRRTPGDRRARMVGGRGVRLASGSGVNQSELFLCIDADDAATDANVRQASGVDPAWLPNQMTVQRDEQYFNPARKQVEARRRRYWSDLLLSEQTAPITDDAQCQDLLFEAAREQLHSVLPDEESGLQSWLTRMACLRQWAPELELPEVNDAFLTELLRELCPHRRSFDELKEAPWLQWLHARLTPSQRQAVDRECPEKITVPSGSRISVQYAVGKSPVLAVRIQEIFSWQQTPRLALGRVPILLHLLAPNFRPQQVTDDLASFWNSTYSEVRKELRRRYPKHAWPENPLTAKPENKGGMRHR